MATSGMKFIIALLCLSFCPHLGTTAFLQGPKCGLPQVKSLLDRSLRIVGGSEALHGSHPWLVSLQHGGLHFCGASILTDHWILTAAHCLYSMSAGFQNNVNVVVGEHIQRVADEGEQRFRIKTIRIHEKYQPSSPMNYDIALLELDGLIQFGEHAQPLCLPLPSEKFPPGTSCIVGGWGRVRERGPLPPVLREVMLDLLETARCKHVLQTLRPKQLSLTVVCAGPERGGRDACQGDSGGPLICPREDGHWAVVGVTSWGKGCGRSWNNNLLKPPTMRGSPGVFTDVKAFLPWIKRILKEAELKPGLPPRLCHVIDGPLTENQGLINFPDRPAKYYANNEICSWSISTFAGNHILLEFLEFDLENDTFCHSDQLTVFGGLGRVIGRYCGNQLPGPVLISSSRAAIQFVSDASDTRTGFSIQYKSVAEDFQFGPGCGTVAQFQAHRAIRSPRYPGAYSNNADCRWVIYAPKGHVVKLDFHDFDLEQSEYCQYDSLKISGDFDGRQEIVVLCGGTDPPPVLSYDSIMFLHFTSDSSVTGRGFHATPTFINRSDLQEAESTELENESGHITVDSRHVQTGLCGMAHSLAGSELGGLEGGEGTSPQPWPSDVRLLLGTEVICLGAIIQPNWILTAAHCVNSLDGEMLSALSVETGDPDSQSQRVRKVLSHPQYEATSLDSDIALLQLDSELLLTDHTQLVCLPSPPQHSSVTLDCKTSLGSKHGGTLRNNASQSVEVSLVEHADCERYYPGRLTDTMLCAKHEELNDHSSSMDHSGAPLVCRTDSSFLVLGVASWREGDGKFSRPVVYSSVQLAVDWILEQLDVTLDSEIEEDPDEKDFRSESSGAF